MGKRRKGLRTRFKRTKDDERKSRALCKNLEETEHNRIPLQPLSSNIQQHRDSDPLSFQSLKTAHSFIPAEWTIVSTETDTVQFCIIGSNPPVVMRSVCVTRDLSWHAFIFGQKLSSSNAVIQGLPVSLISKISLQQVLNRIQKAHLCPGSPEDHFVKMLADRGGKRYNTHSGELIAFIDKKSEHARTTVRTNDCELICHQSVQRCLSCSKYRTRLHIDKYRERNKTETAHYTSHDSHVNYCCLSSEQKDERMRNLEKAKRTERLRNTRLHKEILNEIENNGVVLNGLDEEDMQSVASDVSAQVASFPVDSPQRIFWEQQMQYNITQKKQMKWHPFVIRFALNLKYASTSAYRAVRQSGVISLPSERTLRDYTHWISIKDGPQSELLFHIRKSLGVSETEESMPNSYALLMDEMKIRSGLLFKKNTGELVGYANLGDANENLQELVEVLNGKKVTQKKIAEEILVFMLRDISRPSTSFPVAMYPSVSLSGEKLYPLVFEVVEALELHGFSIVSITSDGNSPNRKFYRICGIDNVKPVYKTPNPYASGHNIYFFCDPPHLLKTTRNNFANSYAHSNTRTLWVSSTTYE